MNNAHDTEPKNRVRKTLPKSRMLNNQARSWGTKGGAGSDPTMITRASCITYNSCGCVAK